MAEARWLNDDEQRIWRAFLVATRLLGSQFERDLQRGAGLPLTYYEILSTLSEASGRTLQMSQLACALQMSPSRISHAVSRLEREGWVRRELCASDRRSWFAVLTDEGFAALEAAAPCHVESVREHLFDPLTPAQLDQLGEISAALLGHLTSIDGAAEECGRDPS
ncbi:MAG: MarR family transcriptional regulator [Chloroflexi bacterium]|nr:MarR family transcriptional regulator [Chloroflexota bacterium]